MYTKTKILKNHECLTASQYVRADGTGDSRSGMRLLDPSLTKVSAHARSAALSEPASSKWPVRGTATPRVGTGPSGGEAGEWISTHQSMKRLLMQFRVHTETSPYGAITWQDVVQCQRHPVIYGTTKIPVPCHHTPVLARLYLRQPKQHSVTEQMQKV